MKSSAPSKIKKFKKIDKTQLVTTSTEQTYQNNNPLRIIYNQHLSARLIISMQPLTPYVTKGGTRANKIDSKTQSSSKSSEINIDSNLIVEPPEISKNKLAENEQAVTINKSLFNKYIKLNF